MHVPYWTQGVCMLFFRKGVSKSSLEPLSYPSSPSDSCCVKAAFSAMMKCPNRTSSGSWHKVWLLVVQKKWV